MRIAVTWLLALALISMCGLEYKPEPDPLTLQADLDGYMLYAWVVPASEDLSDIDDLKVYAVIGDTHISMKPHESRFRCLLPWNGDLAQLSIVARGIVMGQKVELRCRPARKVYLAFGTMR